MDKLAEETALDRRRERKPPQPYSPSSTFVSPPETLETTETNQPGSDADVEADSDSDGLIVDADVVSANRARRKRKQDCQEDLGDDVEDTPKEKETKISEPGSNREERENKQSRPAAPKLQETTRNTGEPKTVKDVDKVTEWLKEREVLGTDDGNTAITTYEEQVRSTCPNCEHVLPYDLGE